MDTATFDRLSRWFGTSGTRRAALGVLLGGVVLLGSAPSTVAAKGKHRTRNGKGQRRDAPTQPPSDGIRVQGQKNDAPHCLSPVGLDLNTFYGVSEQIVAPFCLHLHAGQSWRVSSRWFVNDTFAEAPGEEIFVPAGDTPLADLRAKLRGVKYVIDPGTRQEKTVVFPTGDKLFTGEQDLTGEGDLFPIANTITLGALKPLAVGPHALDVYWQLSAMHCDGFSSNVAENCLPAGDVRFVFDPDLDAIPIEVISAHQ